MIANLTRAGGVLIRITIAVAVACLTVAGISVADPARASIRKQTNIPAQALGSALQELAKQRDFQVICRVDLVSGLKSRPVAGELTLEETLGQLLSGTNLAYRYLDSNTVTIVPAPSGSGSEGKELKDADARSNPTEAHKSVSFRDQFRVVRMEQGEASSDGAVEDGDTAASEEKSARLDEIVVTAQRREERLQDVPMSIADITNQDIERRGLIGMEDYLRSVPGVNQIDTGPRSNAIVIRGITISPELENLSSGATVASYFDETPITGAAGPSGDGIDVRPVDIERIEILRGPQGTAYGSSSLSGAMRIIPNRPDLSSFGGKLAAAYSDTSGAGNENSMPQAVLNIPIATDKLALRAVGYRYDEGGFYRNIAGIDPTAITRAESWGFADFEPGKVQDNRGRMVSIGGRLAALWQATDKLDLSMNFLTQRIEQDGQPLARVGAYDHIVMPIVQQSRLRNTAEETFDSDIDLVNLVLNYDLGWGALTSAASWVDGGLSYVRDFLQAFPASNAISNQFESFTVETRLASKFEGPFQFLGGVFYEDVDQGLSQIIDSPGDPAPNPFGTSPIATIQSKGPREQHAVFGEVSYDLSDKLTASVGGRYFKYNRDGNGLSEGGLLGVPLGTGVRQRLEVSDDGSTFKANLRYKPTKDSQLYASWAEGFRLWMPHLPDC